MDGRFAGDGGTCEDVGESDVDDSAVEDEVVLGGAIAQRDEGGVGEELLDPGTSETGETLGDSVDTEGESCDGDGVTDCGDCDSDGEVQVDCEECDEFSIGNSDEFLGPVYFRVVATHKEND